MKRLLFSVVMFFVFCAVDARLLSLNEAIEIAKKNSYSAQMANLSFMSQYWSYRSYKAQWLPSLNMSGSLMNYNRSIVEARDYESGRVSYVENNSLSNALRLSVNQNLPWADGTLSLQSNLSRLDQFNYDLQTYNSMPLLLSYNQPLRRYSSLEWQKKSAPLQYEASKRNYVETMQNIAISVTSLYFSALTSQSDYKQSLAKHKDLNELYKKTMKKMDLGLVMKSELLQLELSLLRAEMSISTSRLAMENSLFNLFSYLHISDYEGVVLVPPVGLPDLLIDVNDVIEKAYSNSTHSISQQISLLNAERNLEQTKANNGLQVSLQAQIGLTRSADDFRGAYTRLKDNEVVGITFSLPVYDWGIGRGRTRIAKAELELVRTQINQNNMEFEQDIRTKVMVFNSQAEQCKISRRALEIAEENYLAAYKRYENGSMTITDLNVANSDLENAQAQYLSQLYSFWSNYYSIQKLTLYDYINMCDLDCNYDEIIK